MKEIKEKLLNWSNKITAYHIPRWEELPDIDLYMDQVIALMERYLNIFIRKGGDRLITPSMINNYVKLEIIPPPIRKKYSKKHIAFLIVICILKQVLTISEIKELIIHQMSKSDMSVVYNHFCIEQEAAFEKIIIQIKDKNDEFIIDNKEKTLENLALNMATVANAGKTLAEKMIDLQKENINPQEPEKEKIRERTKHKGKQE